MSTRKGNITASDLQRKSFYSVLSAEVQSGLYKFNFEDETQHLNISNLKQAIDNPVELFETVREALVENKEISQSLAHLKVSARIKTEFTNDGDVWLTNSDVMFYEVMLMEALNFTAREKLIVFNDLIRSYGRYVHSDVFKYNENKEEEIQILKEAV